MRTIIAALLALILLPMPTLAQTPVSVPDGTGYGPGVAMLPPDGKGIAIVATGPTHGSSLLPIVVRNNTSRSVAGLSVRVYARGSEGDLITSGDAYNIVPDVLPESGVGIGIAILTNDVPDDATFEFKIETGDRDRDQVALTVEEATYSQGGVAGTFRNPSKRDVEQVYGLVMCLDTSGKVVSFGATNGQDVISGNETAYFGSGLIWWGSKDDCANFIVAARAEYIRT